jgi:nucleosome assembly protein 1-like 1
MSQNQNIQPRQNEGGIAPTPQNTPLNTNVLASRPAGMGKPQVEDIGENEDEGDDGEDVGAVNPASLLAQVRAQTICVTNSPPSLPHTDLG